MSYVISTFTHKLTYTVPFIDLVSVPHNNQVSCCVTTNTTTKVLRAGLSPLAPLAANSHGVLLKI